MWAVPALAQPPAPAAADDAATIKVGVTIFTDYTVTDRPKGTDAEGNAITPNAFNVGRSYIDITGTITRLIAFRVTPDIARETGSGTSLNGSYVFRLKYAFAQINLDDWMPRGSWLRFGQQQTPWVDYEETTYRYRFQGTVFSEREGYLSSADVGASFRYSLPRSYGDVHAGVYNGDTYAKAEANDQKGLMVRASFRPMPASPILGGLRLNGFFDADSYVKNGERRRGLVSVSLEHPNVNAGFQYLATADRILAAAPSVKGRGWSAFATPKSADNVGLEGLFRFDHMKPDTDAPGTRNRTIVGVSYWFPHQGGVAAALLFDVEDVDNQDFAPARPDERRYAVHALVNF
jgi:hypothetical protein